MKFTFKEFAEFLGKYYDVTVQMVWREMGHEGRCRTVGPQNVWDNVDITEESLIPTDTGMRLYGADGRGAVKHTLLLRAHGDMPICFMELKEKQPQGEAIIGAQEL